MLIQGLGLIGAALVLVGYWSVASGKFMPASMPTIGLNAAGSIILLYVAITNMSLGYILLNAAWLLIAFNTWRKRGEVAWEHRAR